MTPLVLSLLAVGLFLLQWEFPKKVDIALPAVEYRIGDASSTKFTTIRVQGVLYKPIFRNHYFRGKLMMDDYEITKTYELIDIVFDNRVLSGAGALSYTITENGTLDLQMFGLVRKSGDFTKLHIQVFHQPSHTDPNIRISAPARSYEEAQSIYNQLEPKQP